MSNLEAEGPETTGPEQSIPAAAEVDVFEGLISAGLDSDQAFRTTQAIREQAGRNITDKLEAIQGQLETHKAQIATMVAGVRTELKALKDRVANVGWALGFMAVLRGLITYRTYFPETSAWRGPDPTPAESGQAPVAPDRTEPADPPESDPPVAPPPQTGSLLRDWQRFPHRDRAWARTFDFRVRARGSDWRSVGQFRSAAIAARLVPDRGEFCGPSGDSSPAGSTLGNGYLSAGWAGGVTLYRQAMPRSSGGWIRTWPTQGIGHFQVEERRQSGYRAASPGAGPDSVAARWQAVSPNRGIDPSALTKFSADPANVSVAASPTPGPFQTCRGPVSGRWRMARYAGPASAGTRKAAPFTAIAVTENPQQSLGASRLSAGSGAVAF